MSWMKTVRYQKVVMVEDKFYKVVCENDYDGDFDESFALSINGEYVCEVLSLPDTKEIAKHVGEMKELSKMSFAGRPQVRS